MEIPIERKKVVLSQMPQLDGLRALCLLSIIVHHWTVKAFHIPFPFEIGAFVFFALSGYLITRILLRGKNKIAQGTTTTRHFLKSFAYRRLFRLAPAYLTGILLYLLIWYPEVRQNLFWYATNTSNIHFALEGGWQGGADQFWTLAVDQQFYAFWPFLILLLPRKVLPYAFALVACSAPFSRYLGYLEVPYFLGDKDDLMPWFLTDHLCFGALLAYAHEFARLPSKKIFWVGLITFLVAYLAARYRFWFFEEGSLSLIWQQTFLAGFSACLVGLAVYGFTGVGKSLLENRVIQYIGQRSYGYYVYHNLAMLLLGFIAFPLYPAEGATDYFFFPRLIMGAGLLYAMAHYSWKYIEEPFLQRKAQHKYLAK